MSWTLFLYALRANAAGLAIMSAIALGLAAVIDFVERFRSFAEAEGASFLVLAGLTAARLPTLFLDMLPFVVLLGVLWTYMRLNRRLELASARAAGVSIAAAAMPALAAAALSAGLSIAVVGPVAAALQSQAERTTVRLAGSQSGLVAVQNARFWIRQTHPEGRVIIRADRFLADGPSLVSPTFLIFDDDQRFLRRWDSERADLQQGGWQLMQAQSLTPDGRVNRKPAHRIPTDLTASQLRGGVDQPESMSIFALPAFIERAEQAGFAVTHHRFAFHERLAQPLLLMAMAALAAASAQHHARGRNPALLVGLALATGFFVFFATAVAEAFGRSGAAPVMLAAWTPPTAAFLIGIGALAQADST